MTLPKDSAAGTVKRWALNNMGGLSPLPTYENATCFLITGIEYVLATDYDALEAAFQAVTAERANAIESAHDATLRAQRLHDELTAAQQAAQAAIESEARLMAEMDARCDRAYCDGADAVLCIGPSGDDEASVSARLAAVSEWRASGYGGRRAASRAALSTHPSAREQGEGA